MTKFEIILMAGLVADVYFIVFCRLAIHASRGQGGSQPGLLLVTSLPSREGLSPRGLRYWRLYWVGSAILGALGGLLLWLRYPHIAAALKQAS